MYFDRRIKVAPDCLGEDAVGDMLLLFWREDAKMQSGKSHDGIKGIIDPGCELPFKVSDILLDIPYFFDFRNAILC
ncbi:MAG: hypothetical protein MR820_10700 [Prevotella sp.]|nr:hypothetical protein [Prevotella sp.]